MFSESRKRIADEKSYSFGEFMESTCHCNLKPSTTSLSELGEDEQTIFKMRAGVMITDESDVNICRYTWVLCHLPKPEEKEDSRFS